MNRLLRDPDFPVTPSFLDALALLEVPPPKAVWPSIRAKLPLLRRQLFDALPAKRGQALVTSRQTYMAGLEQLAAVKFSFDQIIQIIEIFERLSTPDQDLWLGQRWTQVSDQRWLPVLQKLALRDVNLHQQRNPDLDPVAGISKLALKRWYELDPKTGREAILREITSPAPRFGADGLGILPDRTLTAEQHTIAQNFVSLTPPAPVFPSPANQYRYIHRYDDLAAYQTIETHLTSLLFRYADRDVIPEVLPTMTNRLAEWNCNAQDNALAFLLKADPDEAGSLLRSIARTGCDHHPRKKIH